MEKSVLSTSRSAVDELVLFTPSNSVGELVSSFEIYRFEVVAFNSITEKKNNFVCVFNVSRQFLTSINLHLHSMHHFHNM